MSGAIGVGSVLRTIRVIGVDIGRRIAVLAVLVAPARAQTLPNLVAPLPTPTGPAPVGTTTVRLTDQTRKDSLLPNGRPITVQLWYPAREPVARFQTATYLSDPGLPAALLAGPYYGIDSVSLTAWSGVVTHGHVDAPVGAGRHPLATFSVGLGVIRASYTSIYEELASWGYIVAAVESPGAGLMVIPGGKVIDGPQKLNEAPFHRAQVTEWSRDITFALDRLAAHELHGVAGDVASAIDWTQVGAAGHSTGGLVALETCVRDPRFRACADLDGGFVTPASEPLADFVPTGTTKPTLMLRSQPLYADSDLAKRGLTREQWEKRGAAGTASLDSIVRRAQAPFSILSVAGTGHFSFSDAPFLMASAITRFGGKIIDGKRGWLVITTTLRSFLDEYLGRASPNRFAAVTAEFPELTVRPAPR